jgi:parallel beta-helix repeat protein
MMIAAAFVPSGMAVMSEDEPGIASEGEAALLASVIRVDSEAELAELVSSGTASGSGTIADPYVIDGLEIDAAGQGAAIYIGNTTSYLRISNCTLYGASYKTEHFANGGGIILYRVQNATVENNAITSSHHGAYGEYALNIVFNGNTISAVNFYGIAISSSDLCVIGSNDVTTSNSGVSITNGEDCEVRDNLLSGNSNSGVRVDTSSNILVENNTCDNDGMSGISISNSDHLSVLDNSCVGSRRGVSMWSSSLNLIEGNVINSSTEYGIMADSSHQNRFANNTVLLSYDYGFFLSYSSNNLLEGNNVSDHDRYYGVYLLLGTGNMLLNNTFLRDSTGIHMFRTSHNTVEGNVFIDTGWGMDIDTADWNLIANNSFNGGYTGIEAYSHDTVQSKGCNNNTITGNLFRGGSNYGIMFLTTKGPCKNNTIEYNTFLDNFLGGVVLMEWDDDNLIVSNAFIDNYLIGSAQCSDPSLSRWNDSDSGNYWNDLTAPDDDEDGIVDIGYDLDGDNTDFYPRVSPLWIESPAHLQELGTSAMVSGVLINHHLAAEFALENTATGETVNVTAKTQEHGGGTDHRREHPRGQHGGHRRTYVFGPDHPGVHRPVGQHGSGQRHDHLHLRTEFQHHRGRRGLGMAGPYHGAEYSGIRNPVSVGRRHQL